MLLLLEFPICSRHPHPRIAVSDDDSNTNRKSDGRKIQWGATTTSITLAIAIAVAMAIAKRNRSECGVKMRQCRHKHNLSNHIDSRHSHQISVVCSRRRSPRIDETDVDSGTTMNNSSRKMEGNCNISSSSSSHNPPPLTACQWCVSRNPLSKIQMHALRWE
jgi:hypothetical protein